MGLDVLPGVVVPLVEVVPPVGPLLVPGDAPVVVPALPGVAAVPGVPVGVVVEPAAGPVPVAGVVPGVAVVPDARVDPATGVVAGAGVAVAAGLTVAVPAALSLVDVESDVEPVPLSGVTAASGPLPATGAVEPAAGLV